jgi:hypothetical protein
VSALGEEHFCAKNEKGRVLGTKRVACKGWEGAQ